MISIAHEAPVSLMREMAKVTDYDYALACLFDRVPGYYDYFVEALANGRRVILDNGVFEDGVSMEPREYAGWIEKLRPTEYIVPDVFDAKDVTIQNYKDWKVVYGHLPGIAIAVCQGATFDELRQCYMAFADIADKIALNFASKAYQEFGDIVLASSGSPATWDRKAVVGRLHFILNLIQTDRFNHAKPHHLLGCSLPYEYNILKTTLVPSVGKTMLSHFETMDTSAPVVWGILTGEYPDDLGTIEVKNKTKLKDLITANLTDEQAKNIFTNVGKFRKYLT
jgi:hypothetical protein